MQRSEGADWQQHYQMEEALAAGRDGPSYAEVFDRYYLEALQDGYPVKRAEQIAADAASAFLYRQRGLFA